MSERKLREFVTAIEDAMKITGQDFIKPNLYRSFAPVRPNTIAHWLVDFSF